jgi:glycosyltransferase involved in cell wall biosynthesis
MRIGLITGEYPPLQGGVGAFSRELAAALAQQGHSLHILTDRRVASAGEPVGEPGIDVTAAIRDWNRASLFDARHWARSNRLDVVNIQYEAAAFRMAPLVHWLPMLLRSASPPNNRFPVVTTFHDLFVPYLFPKAGALRRWVLLALARQSDGVIATNRQDEQQLHAAGRIARLRQIPIGSNVRAELPPGYDRAGWRARLGIPAQGILIGYFGFLNASKGVDTLLDGAASAVAQGVDVHLLLIGGRTGDSDPANANHADEIDRQIDILGLQSRIHRTGFVDGPEVSGYLSACDVLALPFKDGVSFRRGSFMAALAHGCAIITTRPQVNLPELVDGENVRLIPPDAGESLSAAIRELASDSALRERLRVNARKLAGLFTWDRIAAQTAAFYQDVIGAIAR